MTAAEMYERAVEWGTGQMSWNNLIVGTMGNPGQEQALIAQADSASAQGWLVAGQAQERLDDMVAKVQEAET